MRRLSATAVVLLGLLALTGTATAAQHRPTCNVHGAHVLVSDRRAVLYKLGEVSWGRHEAQESAGGIYGCLRGHARYRLGERAGCGKSGCVSGIYREALAGTLVAYAWENGSEPEVVIPKDYFIVVRDLRTGRVRLRIPAGPLKEPEHGAAGSGSVASIVLRSDGALAWIAYDFQLSRETRAGWLYTYFVYAQDRQGNRRLLGSGTTLGSSKEPVLELHGHKLSWIENGKARSARLG